MLRNLLTLGDRLMQKLVLFLFYYIPVGRACLTPNHRSSDIREAHAGTCSFATGRYAIYVLWQPRTVPWYVVNLLEGLKRHEVNTIVVSNEKLNDEQLATLTPLCAEVLVRKNKGLDFGAYKDAILRLSDGKVPLSRVLLLNDSVYMFRRGLDELLTALLAEDMPMVAAHENWEKHYHFQSFCLGFSGSLLNDPKIQKFWRHYRPISIRRWCIDHGEVKFSAAIRKAASSFKVVYSINDLLDALSEGSDWPTLLQYKEFVPESVRDDYPKDDVLAMLSHSGKDERAIILRRLKERLSELLMRRAQSHTGAFFFPKFLSSPILKRDIVYRQLFTVYEVERMLLELGCTEELQSITDEIRRRGSAQHLRGLAKRRYRLGLI
jgi:rhamnan synthesis protein F